MSVPFDRIILLPNWDDDSGLLTAGPYGPPPQVFQETGCGVGHSKAWHSWDDYSYRLPCYMCTSPTAALVIAADGRVHRQGVVIAGAAMWPDLTHWDRCIRLALEGHPHKASLASLVAQEHPTARLLFINTEGFEVKP